MALDAIRNTAYEAALRRVVTPETVVLDVGAGTGIHGLLAAKLGAKSVYLVEPEDIIAVAEETVRAHGWDDRVHCIHRRMEEVTLPEPVDVIVSVLTGNFLLTEDLLPTLLHARDTALKPGGILIPDVAVMEAVPVSAPHLHRREISAWSDPQVGLDMSAARGYAANTVFYRSDELADAVYLAEPRPLHTLDLSKDEYDTLRSTVSYTITQSGECHGWVGWLRIHLGDAWLSTSPRDPSVHWTPAFLPLDPPVAVKVGERVSFELTRAPHGDWTWTIESESGRQRHSTFLGTPMKASTVQKADLDYAPALNPDGEAMAHVLRHCDASTNVTEIAQSLVERFPSRYRTSQDAVRFVQQTIKRYC